MQQVIKAVAAIRAQLQLAQNDDDDIPSVERDKKTLEALKKKLDNLFGEIKDLQGALLAEEQKAVQEEFPEWTAEAIAEEARTRVNSILKELGVDARE